MDCAGRAQRRRRFRTHHTPKNHPGPWPARKRCRASLATAVQNCLFSCNACVHNTVAARAGTSFERSRDLFCHGQHVSTAAPLFRQSPAGGIKRVTLNPPQTGDILDCAGRAQRRRRFRTHYRPANNPSPAPARKRCRALLATAVHDAGASHHGSRTCEASRSTIWRH